MPKPFELIANAPFLRCKKSCEWRSSRPTSRRHCAAKASGCDSPGRYRIIGFARHKLPKTLVSLVLLGMNSVPQAATTSASFGVSMVIVPSCTISASAAVNLRVACVANGVDPLVVLGDRQPPAQRLSDDATRDITIVY
jgi:hypothetical protein